MAVTSPIPEQDFVLEEKLRAHSVRPLLPWLILGFAGLLVLAGVLLWPLWTNDALRSIGMYFPVVSVILILRVWRQLGWERRGTWWGLLPLLYAVIMGRAGGNALQVMAFTSRSSLSLLPLGLTVFAYGSGVVLLLGGWRVWRKALFPLVLLLLVNPVPAAFAQIDLPLQYFCARTAHAFALAIGVHPDASQLRLMFAPDFGMFIAPGCDGIRGAVTMGYLALILGYVYRFSLRLHIVSVLAAVALGYVFNLLRLCVLVLFYWVALQFPSLQAHGEGADYMIGGLLFLSAGLMFAALVRWKKRSGNAAESAPVAGAAVMSPDHAGFRWKAAVTTVLVALSSFVCVRSALDTARTNIASDVPATMLPQQMGKYRLLRSWPERDWINRLAYRWGAYSDGDPGNEIDIAFWLGPGAHYPVACHLAQGDKPAEHLVQKLPTANGGSATFNLYFYDESDGQTLEAATLCDAGGCNENVLLPAHTGLVFAGMNLTDFLFRPTSRPLPILIRVRSSNAISGTEAGRAELTNQLQQFVAQLDARHWVEFAKSRQ
jgi:exosortase J